MSSSLFTTDWADLLELLELEADPPRGQAATTRTVRRLGFPRFPSSPHRRTDWCKVAVPAGAQSAHIFLISLTTRHLCSSSPSRGLPDEQCRCCRVWSLSSAWGLDEDEEGCRFRLVDFEHASVCLRLGGSCAASTSLLWPTGHEPRRYHILRYATLRARRLEERVPCRLPFPRIGRQAISKVCVRPTPPHVVGERHGCSKSSMKEAALEPLQTDGGTVLE
jgi:hypothetical protein